MFKLPTFRLTRGFVMGRVIIVAIIVAFGVMGMILANAVISPIGDGIDTPGAGFIIGAGAGTLLLDFTLNKLRSRIEKSN